MSEPVKQDLQQLLDNITIVLVEPKYAENIGAAARSAMNMGVSHLIVVRDQPPEQEKMLKMATHKAAHLIENMELYDNLEEALAGFSYVVGTTARLGGLRQQIIAPRQLPEKVFPLLAENRVAILFGPEHRGLTNEDIKYCQLLSNIPTADFSSLNLAQAVAIHCYELFDGLQVLVKERRQFSPKLAASIELEGMYDHLEQVLQRVGFLKGENDEYWMHNIRRFLGRVQLRSKEVKIIRGFCRQLLWYDENRAGAGSSGRPESQQPPAEGNG